MHSQVGVSRELRFPGCQPSRLGNTEGKGEQRECALASGGCQGLMGADGRQRSPVSAFDLLMLMPTALDTVYYEPPLGHLGNL